MQWLDARSRHSAKEVIPLLCMAVGMTCSQLLGGFFKSALVIMGQSSVSPVRFP
jgi:hypothetical protein